MNFSFARAIAPALLAVSLLIPAGIAFAVVLNPTTGAADSITSSGAVLHATNGPLDATGSSFWVSLDPAFTITGTDPAADNAYTTADFGAVPAGDAFSASLSSVTGLPAITPDTPYYFVAWVNVGGTWYHGAIETFTTLATHTLTYTAGAHGSITGTSPQTVDDEANGSAVTAVPDAGYHFVDWSGDSSTDNPRTDTNVTGDTSVTANFAPSDIYVDATGGLDTNDGSSGSPVETIQHAIDIAAPGVTIYVAAGTYEGFSVVGKSDITIEGAGAGSTVIAPSTLVDSGIAHKYTLDMMVSVFVNGSTGITLQGMTVTDNGSAPGAGGPDALVFWDSASGTIQDSTLSATYAINGDQTGQGIAVDAGNGQATDLTVNDVAISGFQKNGIDVVDGEGATGVSDTITVSVSGGSITGADSTGTIAQNGISAYNRGGGSMSVTVDGENISNLDYTGANSASGILAFNTASIPTISNTTFTNVQLYIGNVEGGASTDATVGNTFDGISPASATNAQLGAIEDKLSGLTEDSSAQPIYILPNSTIATLNNLGIQAAIDAAPVGGTVYVVSGAYAENLTIANALTLKGAQFGVAAMDATRSDATATSSPDFSNESEITGTVTISAPDVTLDGFTVATGGSGYGVNLTGSYADYTIENNVIRDNGYGILLNGSDTSAASVISDNALIDNNLATEGHGISAQSQTSNLTIQGNYFEGNWNSGGNSESINFYGIPGGGVYHSGITVEDNEAYDTSFVFGSLDGLTVTGNTLEMADIYDSTALFIAGDVQTATITGNTLLGNTRDFYIAPDYFGIPMASSNFTFNNNQLLGGSSTAGVVVDTADSRYSGTFDASQNWWDRTNGPTATDNANSDTGSTVSDGVIYRPWCTSHDCAFFDTTVPTVTNASAIPNPAKAEDVSITVDFSEAMNTDIAPTVTVTGLSGGTLTATGSFTNDTTWEGTVTVPADNEEADAVISVAGAEDPSGNQLVTDTSHTFTVDTLAPVIDSITSDATGSGALKIGDTITFTVTPDKTELSASVDGSYNGQTLSWATSDFGNTYTATYTVTAGEDDQTSPLQITGVTMTDEVGNVSTSADGSDVGMTIDANKPTLTTYTISNLIFSPNASTGIKDTTDIDTAFSEPSHVTIDIEDSSHAVVNNLYTSGGLVMNPTAKHWDGTDNSSAQVPEDTYTVVVTATDAAGNSTTDSSQTIIVDNSAPLLDTNADMPGNEAADASGAIVNFTDPGATDNVDGSSDTVSCVPDSGSLFALGTTTVTCMATDVAGNTGSSAFDIGVVDTTPPVITLNGTDPESIAEGDTYTEAGANASDTVDGTDTVVVGGDTVNTAVPGIYTVTYDATDNAGNNATQVTRTVTVSDSDVSVTPIDNGDGTATGELTNGLTYTTSPGGVDAVFMIPAGTNITGLDTWNGDLPLPSHSVSFTNPTVDSGSNLTITLSVQAGPEDQTLTFDRGVRILFTGRANDHVGWSRGGVFTEITDVCSADSQVAGDALAPGGDCKINVGSDLVVWTKHFTTFLTYTVTTGPVPNSGNGGGSSGGGGGGGGGGIVAVPTGNTAPSAPAGQVLGAAAYNFTADLTVGSTGQDVTELQSILIAEGDLDIPTPTGYFGILTKAAVIKYQIAHGITPASGFVGPLTRAELNKGETGGSVLGASTGPKLSDSQSSALISLLEAFGVDAGTIAKVKAELGAE